MARKAAFHNGEPANLPAAAMDALEWCEWLHKYADKHLVFSQSDSMTRLAAAIDELKKQLEPHLPPRFTAEETPPASGATEGE